MNRKNAAVTTHLNRPPVVHLQRAPRILIPILRLEIHSGIVNQHIDTSLLALQIRGERADALAVGDVEFRVDDLLLRGRSS